MKRIFVGTFILIAFVCGVGAGGYLFSDIQPRVLLSLPGCTTNCMSSSQAKGLLVSLGIQHFPGMLPAIIKETNTVIVIKSPEPQARMDYLILPKKDIKDLSQLTPDDRQYIDDSFMVISEIIQEDDLTNYQVVINGPQRQQLNYLHFHLLAN